MKQVVLTLQRSSPSEHLPRRTKSSGLNVTAVPREEAPWPACSPDGSLHFVSCPAGQCSMTIAMLHVGKLHMWVLACFQCSSA